jgi:hypothetical protein
MPRFGTPQARHVPPESGSHPPGPPPGTGPARHVRRDGPATAPRLPASANLRTPARHRRYTAPWASTPAATACGGFLTDPRRKAIHQHQQEAFGAPPHPPEVAGLGGHRGFRCGRQCAQRLRRSSPARAYRGISGRAAAAATRWRTSQPPPSHSRPRAPATWRIRAWPSRHDDGSAQGPAGKHSQETRWMRTPAGDQRQKGAAMVIESRHMQVRWGP